MAKINDFTYGQLISAESKKAGSPYTDWRCGFMNCPGIILLCESEHKQPGMGFICFYPNSGRSLPKDDSVIAFQPAYFHTSLGNISKNGNTIVIDTDNSRYIFEEGEFGLNESDKKLLMLCAGLHRIPERNKIGNENEQETTDGSS